MLGTCRPSWQSRRATSVSNTDNYTQNQSGSSHVRVVRMCAKSKHVISRLTPRAPPLHDTVKSYIHSCFQYFRRSKRAPQTQRSASYVCQLHRWVHACAAALPNHTHILHARNSCEACVHSARSAEERSNNTWKHPLATQHLAVVLHPQPKCMKTKTHAMKLPHTRMYTHVPRVSGQPH